MIDMNRNGFWLFSLFVCMSTLAMGQNLVSNPGFESHKDLSIYYHQHFVDLGMKDWSGYLYSIHTFVCDSTFKTRSSEDVKAQYCPMNTPKSGTSMVQMIYTPRCNASGDTGEGGHPGCSNYLFQKLKSPLEMGIVYKISLWLYWDDIFMNEDPQAMSHFGVITSYDNLPIDKRSRSLIRFNPLPINVNLEKEKWIQLEWYIQPTCIQNYLTLGIFKGDKKWWGTRPDINFGRTIFYIDDVSIEEVPRVNIPSGVQPVFFCNEYLIEDKPPTQYQKTIYFDSNMDVPRDLEVLDSICANVDAEATYVLSGYTDSIGDGADNLDLSDRRIDFVLQYLVNHSTIREDQIMKLSWGQRRPFGKNNTNEGRAQNRRVTITRSSLDKSTALYRNAILALKNNNRKEAVRLLNGWAIHAKKNELILGLFDPRTKSIVAKREGRLIRNLIRKAYGHFEKPKLSFVLDSLYCEDQKYRTLGRYVEDLGGFFEGLDQEWYPSARAEELIDDNQRILHKLLEVIKEYGYPNQSEVGRRQAKAAAYILIHSEDTPLMQKYLPILEQKCTIGEANWMSYAMMYDRLKLLNKEPQRFGTQYLINKDGQETLWKLEDESKVDFWRNKIGLLPLKK